MVLRHGGNRAFWTSGTENIQMPHRRARRIVEELGGSGPGVDDVEKLEADIDKSLTKTMKQRLGLKANQKLPDDVQATIKAAAASASQASIENAIVRQAAEIATDGPFPLVVYSHGSGGIRYLASYYTEAIASHGYVVAAPDHTGNTAADRLLGAEADFDVALELSPQDAAMWSNRGLARLRQKKLDAARGEKVGRVPRVPWVTDLGWDETVARAGETGRPCGEFTVRRRHDRSGDIDRDDRWSIGRMWIGAGGTEEVIEIELSDEEKKNLKVSTDAVEELLEACKGMDSSLA